MFKFELLENEKTIQLYRQTEAVLFRPVLIIFVLIYFPWYFLLKYELAADYNRLLFFWTILVLIYGINTYVLWLTNVYLITNKRLVIVHYKNFLNKKVFETPLGQILNVSFSVKGFWQALFRFGSVEVRTHGLPEPLMLRNVARPSEVKDFIWKVREHVSKPRVAPAAAVASQPAAKSIPTRTRVL